MVGGKFPKVMSKGLFKGRTFQSVAEYEAALRAYRNGKPAPEPEHARSVNLRLTLDDGATVTVEGPASAETLGAVVDMLAAFERENGKGA